MVGVADEAAPFIDSEIRAVADAFPHARVLTGAEATVERLRSEGCKADLIHLACHGRFSPEAPMSSGLRLADRWLTVRDVYGLRLAGAVVVLSGCDTGRAAIGGGDDLTGLARGFFAGGASQLLMSLWPTHDESTGELVADVYNMWHNQVSPPEGGLAHALCSAQQALIPGCPHPAHWAPFMLLGRG